MKPCAAFFLLLLSSSVAAQTKGRVVEEIIVRVNNEIVTGSDLQRARNSLQDEARQDCRNCSPQQLQSFVAEKEKNLLRDLIDQSLLAQRAKDLGINVEADVVRRLDLIRQQNNIASMEELETKVTESGIPFEDFKGNIRNGLLTQEVTRREVGAKIIIGRDEVQKFYNEHRNDFQRPEQVYLREIFVSTDGKEAESAELEKKARNLLDRVKKGDDFVELAKRHSDGSTAKTGGELGVFERGQLAKELEDLVFRMERNQLTDVIQTKTGFLILKVEQRYEAGLQPLEKVEGEIMNRIYMEKMEPGLRSHLQTLRRESYVVVKSGHVDSAGVVSTPIAEVQPALEDENAKKGRRRFLLFGKRKNPDR